MNSKLLNPDSNMPRIDYPRPQWVRDRWYCLNGLWEFAFDFGKSGEERGMVEHGDFPLKILVPFCPESKLSGIEYTDFIPAVWYRRTFNFQDLPQGRSILHFGAVDYFCKVWVNGILCGSHKGGYTAFEMDITDALKNGDNTIIVYAEDDLRSGRQARGKQSDKFHSYGCSYTRTTGIYQTVWLEIVPERYLKNAQMTPHAADGALDIKIALENARNDDQIRITAYYQENVVGICNSSVSWNQAAARLTVDELHLWNPGAPEIYQLKIELLNSSDAILDTVWSYFALRDIALTKTHLTINGQAVFMRMILDQGFHPEGIYTAPSDEDLKRDIQLAMSLGFNGARFHCRVFEDRSLYWADQLGYLVWGENEILDLSGPQGFYDFLPEWLELVNQYYNHPAVIGWICANETYHKIVLDDQVERMLYHITKTLDPYRPVIDASGGIHYETDLFDVHEYKQDPKKLAEFLQPMLEDEAAYHTPLDRYWGIIPRREEHYTGSPYWISECGGAFFAAPEKRFEGWGYGNAPADEEEFVQRYEGLIGVMIAHPRVCGFCYTQLTDVEQEQNGLYYYDRTPKFTPEIYERIRRTNQKIAQIEKTKENL